MLNLESAYGEGLWERFYLFFVLTRIDKGGSKLERWLGKTGQWDKWRFCPSLAYDGLTEEIG
jgi:hypothetical protein